MTQCPFELTYYYIRLSLVVVSLSKKSLGTPEAFGLERSAGVSVRTFLPRAHRECVLQAVPTTLCIHSTRTCPSAVKLRQGPSLPVYVVWRREDHFLQTHAPPNYPYVPAYIFNVPVFASGLSMI